MRVASPGDPVASRVWVAPPNGVVQAFPEASLPSIRDRPSFGICLSGGGARALSAAVGQLRALKADGLLDKARYISCVSGGSWAATPFTYYRTGPADDDAFLGPYDPPGVITMPLLKTPFASTSLPWAASQDFAYTLWDTWYDTESQYDDEIWIWTIGRLFLEQFGLFDWTTAQNDPGGLAYFSWDADTVKLLKARNKGNLSIQAAQFYTARANRPYLIVNSVIIPNDEALTSELIPYEYTPLYNGMPSLETVGDKTYGGGFLEPFAFSSDGPSQQPGACPVPPIPGQTCVTVPQPALPFTLADATGTSSSAFAQELLQDYGIGDYDPHRMAWPFQAPYPPRSRKTKFGDGGLVENLGVIPLLCRGVKVIYLFNNTETPLSLDYDPGATVRNGLDPNGLIDVYMPALFGLSNSSWAYSYPNNQVFPTDDYVPLVRKLQSAKRNGQTVYVTAQHEVLPNAWWGLRGGYSVVILWVYLDRVAAWERQLVPDVRKHIGESGSRFQRFPNYLTIGENGDESVLLYTEQVRLLADLTTWTMKMSAGRHAGLIESPIAMEEVAPEPA